MEKNFENENDMNIQYEGNIVNESASQNTEVQYADTAESLNDRYLRAFIGGEKFECYQEKFDKVENKKISWNWSAFLVSMFWFIYRKLYVQALVIFVPVTVVSTLVTLKGWDTFSNILEIAVSIVSGCIADRLLHSKYQETVKACAGNEEAIRAKGGTSTKALVISIIVGIAIIIGITVYIIKTGSYSDTL